MKNTPTKIYTKGNFEPANHWYEKALNATIHPMVSFFLSLSKERIIARYCHLQPRVNPQVLNELLSYQTKHFKWAGADLIHVTNESGKKHMAIIENNSCPSGQKSMPLLDDTNEFGGYKTLIEETFLALAQIQKKNCERSFGGDLR